ncbi:MAG: nucleoside-diphosphate kinase [Phycisphaerae bacterium]
MKHDLSDHVRAGNATLVVFSPDAVKSNLVRPVEDALRESGCSPVIRAWIAHNDSSIEQFYSASIPANVPTWHLVSRLFTLGPSLATLWSGADAGRKILAMKGRSHPALAQAGTVRRRFWCDNPVTNLIHVSDDADEVLREMAVLCSLGADRFREPLVGNRLAPFSQWGVPEPNHSGILAICRLVIAGSDAVGSELPPLAIPTNGDAMETVVSAMRWLREASLVMPDNAKPAIMRYLDGTATPDHISQALNSMVPLTLWDDLLVRAAAVARKGWCEHGSGC